MYIKIKNRESYLKIWGAYYREIMALVKGYKSMVKGSDGINTVYMDLDQVQAIRDELALASLTVLPRLKQYLVVEQKFREAQLKSVKEKVVFEMREANDNLDKSERKLVEQIRHEANEDERVKEAEAQYYLAEGDLKSFYQFVNSLSDLNNSIAARLKNK